MFVGPEGSGKTTLFNHLCATWEHTEGDLSHGKFEDKQEVSFSLFTHLPPYPPIHPNNPFSDALGRV